MAHKPIFEGEFDLAVLEENYEDFLDRLLKSIFAEKLMLVGYRAEGPAGGNPSITIRGTKAQLVGWAWHYYVDTENLEADEELLWTKLCESGIVRLIA
jgi:hypothetical protein